MPHQEVTEWLNELKKAGSLSDEEWNVLNSLSTKNDKASQFIRESVLRQADYSRRMAEVDQRKTEVASLEQQIREKEKSVAAFQTDLATWKSGADQKFTQALKDREELERKLVVATSKLKTVADAYGIPDEDWKLSDTVVTPKPPETGNGTPWLTREDADRHITETIKKYAAESAVIDAAMHDLSIQHQELFGKPLIGAVELVQEALKSGKPLTKLWEEKFKVPEKRKELEKSKWDSSVAEEVEKRVAKYESEHQIPHSRPSDQENPFYRHQIFTADLKLPEKPDGQSGVDAALAAYQSGKYRMPLPGSR